MSLKIQPSGAQKRKISQESNERSAAVLAKTKRLTEFFSASLVENIEVNNEERVPDDVSSEEPPAFPSTSAENENNISNQDSEYVESPYLHSRDSSVDMYSETPPCDSDPAMWFPVREKHVSFWSTAIICQNKNDSDSYPESRRYYQSGHGKLDRHCRHLKNSMYRPSKGAVYCFYCTLKSMTGFPAKITLMTEKWQRKNDRDSI